jgi:hypothetical protein
MPSTANYPVDECRGRKLTHALKECQRRRRHGSVCPPIRRAGMRVGGRPRSPPSENTVRASFSATRDKRRDYAGTTVELRLEAARVHVDRGILLPGRKSRVELETRALTASAPVPQSYEMSGFSVPCCALHEHASPSRDRDLANCGTSPARGCRSSDPGSTRPSCSCGIYAQIEVDMNRPAYMMALRSNFAGSR